MILIHASEVAACVGRNRYTSRADMLKVVFKRTFPAQYTKTAHIIGPTQQEVALKCVESANVATTKLVTVMASPVVANSSAECIVAKVAETSVKLKRVVEEDRIITAKAIAVVTKAIDVATIPVEEQRLVVAKIAKVATTAGLRIEQVDTELLKKSAAKTEAEVKIIDKHCQSVAFKNHGTVKEQDAMRGLTDTLGTLVKTDRYHKRRLDVEAPLPVYIGGQSDGEANGVIVEIKNRMNRLFGRVVEYERLQVLAYMYIFGKEGGPASKLVERKGNQVLVHDVPWDEGIWKTTCDELADFASEVESMSRMDV